MTILFLVLIVLCAAVLGFIILIQSPKGGGLAGNIAGFNNQFMGVKQTNDVLEKGTWIFAGLIALLCLFSSFFMGDTTDNDSILNKINTNQGTTAPAQRVPTQPAPLQPGQQAPATQQPR
ncbi:MAG: protein-export rane protein [Segetibacter sp.]|nr:protein-export rane protein [Segetibacter sp.]